MRSRKPREIHMLTHEEFKGRDHFEQEELLGFAYGRLIQDLPASARGFPSLRC